MDAPLMVEGKTFRKVITMVLFGVKRSLFYQGGVIGRRLVHSLQPRLVGW